MADLRLSPLDDRHRGLGGHMTAFGGWDMPLDYGSVVAEHTAVRSSVGAFDLSHLGTLAVTGPGAQACLQAALTNDVEALEPGRAHYTLCLDDDGGIIDDLLLYRLPWGYFVVPNAANTAAVAEAVSACAGGDTEVADVKDALACVAVQGPESTDVLARAGLGVDQLEYLDCEVLAVATPDAEADHSSQGGAAATGVLARSGYTGERGYEVFVPADRAGDLWDRLIAAGATPAGLGCRDTLRLEMGYPLHGNDISRKTSPVEARLGWAVKPGTGFRGEEAYVRAKERGPDRLLWGLHVTGRGIPRRGCPVRSAAGEQVGAVTSGTFSPTLRVGIALAYLDRGVSGGAEVVVDVRGKDVPAVVVRPPFVERDPKS